MTIRWNKARSRLLAMTVALLWALPSQAQHRPRTQRASNPADLARTDRSVNLNVSILPLHQSFGSTETASLGVGISEALSNALKTIPNIVISDDSILTEAAARTDPPSDLSKDDGIVRIGAQLNLAFVVVGNYQTVGNQLLIDARILNVLTGRPLAGIVLSASGEFPGQYSSVLQQLTREVLSALKVTISGEEQADLASTISASKNGEAQKTFVIASERAHRNTVDALRDAISLFDRCLELDPSFAPAYVAKAEARVHLVELQQQTGDRNQQLAREALRDAQTAADKMPRLGQSHQTLARALNTLGEYGGAKAEAVRAIQLSPNDLLALLAYGRAVGEGSIVRTPETDRAFRLQPGLALILADLPKVQIVNQSELYIDVNIESKDAQPPYQVRRLSPNGSKIVALVSGQYTVDVQSDIGDLNKTYDFAAGKDYTLTFRSSDVPTTTVVVYNTGNVTGYISFRGPKTRTIAVEPCATEDVLLPPGQFVIAISSSLGGSALRTQHENLSPGTRLDLNFGITRGFGVQPHCQH